jgi:hypothetical protein
MLVTLSEMETYLGSAYDSSYDDFLNQQLQYISEVVENYCGRQFESKAYVQTYYAEDYYNVEKALKLYNYPVSTVTFIKEDGATIALSEYRIHYPTGTITKPEYFFAGVDKVEVSYTAGYLNIPAPIKQVVMAIVEERFNKKKSGAALNFGSDVQSVSIPGVLSITYDYTLESNMRKNAYGTVLGNYMNMLDGYRSERVLTGSGTVNYVT